MTYATINEIRLHAIANRIMAQSRAMAKGAARKAVFAKGWAVDTFRAEVDYLRLMRAKACR